MDSTTISSILSAADARREELIEFARAIVMTPSVTWAEAAVNQE